MFDKDSSQRERVSKASLKVESLGAIDELNSFLGIVVAFSEDVRLRFLLKEVQKNLLRIGTITAGSGLSFSKSNTKKLEKIIDELEGKLPILKNFVFPGGGKTSSLLQYARSLARRAERRVVALSKEEKIPDQILSYLNRLSDFLFMLAREENSKIGIKDEVWIGRSKR